MGESKALERLMARWPENKINPSLDRIETLLRLLGNPEQSFKSIHIAGTNGKTSTSRMIQQLLLELNLRTGLYTSPHLIHPAERILVDGIAIAQDEFDELLERFEPLLDLAEKQLNDEHLTFFEAITAMAFMYFSEIPIEVGVIEVGMGGRWDATNLIKGEVSLITPISFDHQEYLGDTLDKIAFEKAGILKPEGIAVIAEQDPKAAEVIDNTISQLKIAAYLEGKDFKILKREVAVGGQLFDVSTPYGIHKDIFMNLYGSFQVQNALMAISAVEIFMGNTLDEEIVRTAFEKVTSPGRLEVVHRNPTVIVDAAHNPGGVAVSRAAIEESFNLKEIILILGIMQDKDVLGVLKELKDFAPKVICTQSNSPRALAAADLALLATEVLTSSEVSVIVELKDALAQALEYAKTRKQCGVVVLGSIALAGAVKRLK